jgi:hypothetical protein
MPLLQIELSSALGRCLRWGMEGSLPRRGSMAWQRVPEIKMPWNTDPSSALYLGNKPQNHRDTNCLIRPRRLGTASKSRFNYCDCANLHYGVCNTTCLECPACLSFDTRREYQEIPWAPMFIPANDRVSRIMSIGCFAELCLGHSSGVRVNLLANAL